MLQIRYAALLFCLLSAAACARLNLAPPPATTPTPPSFGNTAAVPQGDTATVVDVIDGDTIDVNLGGQTYRVRYIGVDTPERGEPFYAEATSLNRSLVAGKQVILVRDVSETDRYGRLLRYIYLPDGTFVNAELLRQGYARRVTFPPDVAEQTRFGDIQREAQEAERGLWALSELGDGPCLCSSNAYNCADFDTRAAAQTCYDYCLAEVGSDIHHLDGGGDGLVCESLP